MENIQYMRYALEKDAGALSSIARFGGRALSGMKNFAKKPISTTFKKVTKPNWSSAADNIKDEMKFGVGIGAGILGAGAVATPFVTQRKV